MNLYYMINETPDHAQDNAELIPHETTPAPVKETKKYTPVKKRPKFKKKFTKNNHHEFPPL